LAYAGDTDIATDSPSTARSTPGASPTRRTA